MMNLPTTVNDVVMVNGLVNIIDKPTHFDKHTGNISLLDPILITDSIQIIDSDTITIDRRISNHDETYVIFKCGFSDQKTFQHTIWDDKMGDYTLMRQRIIDTNWETLINDELDVNNACLNFTNVFLTIAKECIPTREVTIRTDDKIWFDSNLPRKCRRRDRLRKTFLGLKKSLKIPKDNQNPYIEEQTTQWSLRSTKHTYKTKDRVTRTPLIPKVTSCALEG